MSAPFTVDQKIANKKDGRTGTVRKVHFQQNKVDGKTQRAYTQVSVAVDPNDRVRGVVNSFWNVEDTMDLVEYQSWARKRGMALPEAPGEAPPDKPQLEQPQPLAPAVRANIEAMQSGKEPAPLAPAEAPDAGEGEGEAE
jgi:hypothetical protein